MGYALGMDSVPEENSITLRVTPGMLYGNFTGPEGWNYAPYFYNSANGPEIPAGWSSSFSANYDVQLLFIDGTADRFRLYDHSDGNYDFLQKGPLYDVALDKPVTGVRNAFPFPVPDVQCTVTENPNSRGEWDKYLVTFSGLDLENHTYMLETQRGGRYMEDNTCTLNAESLGECALVAYRASESAEGYLLETSLKHAVTVQFDGGETPEEPVDMAVKNLRFIEVQKVPALQWDVPVPKADNVRYHIYLSVDGKQWLSVASTKGDMFPMSNMTPGVYPFIKVTTEVDKVAVAETVAKDMSYSYITGEALGAVEGTLTLMENGKYELCFFGMTPNVAYFMEIIRDHGTSTHTDTVDENGVVTYVMDADRVESSLNENGVYQVRELRDCKISENGKTASITACLRGEKAPLAGLLGGETPEEPEIPDEPQTGADITIAVPAGAEVHFGGGVYTTADGKMTILDVTEGTYEAQVKKTGCLTYTIKDIVVEGADIDLGTITLLAGDVDGNDLINSRDINGFRKEFGKSGDEISNFAADMNGDNKVNSRDINVLRKNFGKSAVNDCTVVWQG